jgi:hypothetical protein
MHIDTCRFFKACNVDFRQVLDRGIIFVFSHNLDIIYDTKINLMEQKIKLLNHVRQKST